MFMRCLYMQICKYINLHIHNTHVLLIRKMSPPCLLHVFTHDIPFNTPRPPAYAPYHPPISNASVWRCGGGLSASWASHTKTPPWIWTCSTAKTSTPTAFVIGLNLPGRRVMALGRCVCMLGGSRRVNLSCIKDVHTLCAQHTPTSMLGCHCLHPAHPPMQPRTHILKHTTDTCAYKWNTQPATTHFTSLADPSAVGSGHTALTTLMHEAGAHLVFTCFHVYMYMCVFTCMHVCIHVRMYACMHACMYV